MNEKRDTNLQDLERELRAIRTAVDPPWSRLILNGMWYGGGFALGSVLAITVAGWLLSIFGVLPGLSEIAENLKNVINTRRM